MFHLATECDNNGAFLESSASSDKVTNKIHNLCNKSTIVVYYSLVPYVLQGAVCGVYYLLA